MPISSYRLLPKKQLRDHLAYAQTHRFIEEVHRLEADGRVASRKDLERRLLLAYGSVTLMRAGRLRVNTVNVELLKREYNGDWQYVLLGVRDSVHAGPLRGGQRLDTLPAYVHGYQTDTAVDLLRLAGLPLAGEGEADALDTKTPQPKG